MKIRQLENGNIEMSVNKSEYIHIYNAIFDHATEYSYKDNPLDKIIEQMETFGIPIEVQ